MVSFEVMIRNMPFWVLIAVSEKLKIVISSEVAQGNQIYNSLAIQMVHNSKWRPYLLKIIYVINCLNLIYSYLYECRE